MKIDMKDIPETKRGDPILNYCRKLIKDGVDPQTKLEVYRGEQLDVTIRTVEAGSKLTVTEDTDGKPRFAKYKAGESIKASMAV